MLIISCIKENNKANKTSYLWDQMIQKTRQNAMDSNLLGDGIFDNNNVVYKMAKDVMTCLGKNKTEMELKAKQF